MLRGCLEIEVVLVDSGCSSCYHGNIYSCANANWRFPFIPEKSLDAQSVWLLFTLLLRTNCHYNMLDNRWDIYALWKTSLLENLFSFFLHKPTCADIFIKPSYWFLTSLSRSFPSYLLHRHPILIASSSHLYTQLPQRIHLKSWSPSSRTSASIGHSFIQAVSDGHIVGTHFSSSLISLSTLILLNGAQKAPRGQMFLHQILRPRVRPATSKMVPTGQTHPHQNLPKMIPSTTNAGNTRKKT